MYKYLKSLLRAEGVEPLSIKKKEILQNIYPNKRYSFGEKNKKKNFYVIKRNYNFNGLFSNLIFVIDHIKYAKQMNMIPVVDMENFVTVYNDKHKVNNTLNAWNYYFKNISNYKLSDIYRSKNVYFSDDKRINKKEINQDKSLIKVFNKFIKIHPIHLKHFSILKKKYFKDKKKILGIHIRGTLEKIVRRHSLPPRPEDILKISVKIFREEKCTNVFLVTEDLKYFEIFSDHFKNKLIYLNTPRSKSTMFGDHNSHFSKYSRKNHRYKLGKEALIDALMLSSTDVLLFTTSNLWRFSIVLSKKKRKQYQMLTETKSSNRFIARWQWYLKYYFPILFGNINFKLNKIN